VDAPYGDLVRTSTRFWNAGGFSFKISLFGGAQLKDTSLESLVTGGVAFATPDTAPLAPAAPENALFALSPEPGKDWITWSPKIPIHSPDTVQAAQSKGGILDELAKP
jgi:paraquat-inducible protein B